MPVPPWTHGLAKDLDGAKAAFRRAFERFHNDTTDRQWQDAFATQNTVRERSDRLGGR